MRDWPERNARWLGVIGPSIVIAGAVLAAVGYAPVDGHGYSFLNHTVSSLGDPRHSPHAYFFNWGMMIGATLMALFTYGVGRRMNTRRSPHIARVGVAGALGMALVGLFPDAPPTHQMHLIVSGIAFICTLGLGTSFTIDMLITRQDILPRWLIIPGAFAAFCSGTFLGIMIALGTHTVSHEALQFGRAGDYKWLDIMTLFEWSVMFSILLWAFLTAASMRETQELALALEPVEEAA